MWSMWIQREGEGKERGGGGQKEGKVGGAAQKCVCMAEGEYEG